MWKVLEKWLGIAEKQSRGTPPAIPPTVMPPLHGISISYEGDGMSALAGPSKQLPVQPPPKVPRTEQSFPSYLKTTTPNKALLQNDDRRLATTDVTTYRNGASTAQVVHDFAHASPDMAGAVFSYLRTAITRGYTAVAKNPDGTFNQDATQLLQQIIARMDMLPNYADGFGTVWSLRSVSESWAKELCMYGACAGELILDKALTPYRIQPLSTSNISWRDDNRTPLPIQIVGGTRIELDFPTFFYVALDQDLLTAYAHSMLEPGIKAVLASEDFAQDLQRIIKRAIHPRLKVTIDEEKFKKNIPADIAMEPEKVVNYLNNLITNIEAKINGMKPEDALVFFDAIEVDYVNNGNISLSQEYTSLADIQNARVATGVKTLPSILGHGVGSQNVASTESMLFIKSVAGAVQEKLNEMYSRLFTLSVRLFGLDVVVEFRYDEINLRPELELESFKAVRQSRMLQLEPGHDHRRRGLHDADRQAAAGRHAEAVGHAVQRREPRGATGAGSGQDTAGGGPSNDGSALNQNLNDTPSKNPKSQNGGKKGADIIPMEIR
jgi:hypothetical protein